MEASFVSKIRTVFRIGLGNVFRFFAYKIGVRIGINPVRRLKSFVPQGDFFKQSVVIRGDVVSSSAWKTNGQLFGILNFPIQQDAPDWFKNPITGKRHASQNLEWWRIPDFDSQFGDIKLIWEMSRFDWVIAMAQRASLGDSEELTRLNLWINDWVSKNPPYVGPNWKCGQESSFRVIHLAIASLILHQHSETSEELLALVKSHLKRIAPTVSYAVAQDNNHGTSEAAALFIGGSWLALNNDSDGERWAKEGRRLIEERASKLISSDGSFSQHSVTYHRLMLDTMCAVEVWRKELGLPTFADVWYDRVQMATLWLFSMVDANTGDAPNIGANDGARIIPLTDSDYRDFRPSVQLASVLFFNSVACANEGPWNQPLRWLAIKIPSKVLDLPESRSFESGGYDLLIKGEAKVVMRFPRFRFRPSHADVHHVDFWLGGENLLRDAGTYSYNTEDTWMRYFSSVEGHNTIQFDDRDQMPRISRFLYGDWLKTLKHDPVHEKNGTQYCVSSYRDTAGAFHQRSVELSDGCLKVMDHIDGFRNKATLRWRLEPGDWVLTGLEATSANKRISISSSLATPRIRLSSGWESRYYSDKALLTVIEVDVDKACTLTTVVTWTI
jgi:hypothetical protein